MKSILKLLVLVILVSIFCFSENKAVSTARNFISKNGKALYAKGTGALSQSNVKVIAFTGNTLR